MDLSGQLGNELLSRGAVLVGFADLSALPADERYGMPSGVSIAIAYEKETIRGITDAPTKTYHDEYHKLNARLDFLAGFGAEFLQDAGYKAIAQTLAFINYKDSEQTKSSFATAMPHKTVARLAGLGWIGKCALLVTKQYGSMIRLTSILTDAPLKTAERASDSKCGGCTICTEACPAGAVLGNSWSIGVARDEIFDAAACRRTARELMEKHTGIPNVTICGRCIAVCPYTQRYLDGN